jgi:hypothetical protein
MLLKFSTWASLCDLVYFHVRTEIWMLTKTSSCQGIFLIIVHRLWSAKSSEGWHEQILRMRLLIHANVGRDKYISPTLFQILFFKLRVLRFYWNVSQFSMKGDKNHQIYRKIWDGKKAEQSTSLEGAHIVSNRPVSRTNLAGPSGQLSSPSMRWVCLSTCQTDSRNTCCVPRQHVFSKFETRPSPLAYQLQ